MMMEVSKIFSSDIEEFIKILKIISFTEYDLENKMETGAYTKREILSELREFNHLVKELISIFTLIIEKAQRYKLNNIMLFNHLNYINEYIKKLKLTGQIMEVAYERDPDYGIKGLYRDLKIIVKYTNLIKNELDKGIQKGLFM